MAQADISKTTIPSQVALQLTLVGVPATVTQSVIFFATVIPAVDFRILSVAAEILDSLQIKRD